MKTERTAGATKVVVATTVMLSFISFWRAAAIVLSDLASSAYYAGGIAEHAIGKSAPWFILGIMLFSYAVSAVYIESCSMFVRGGVYKVVHEAMGGTLAKFSVSALMFDYILTGPISGVAAGLYLAGLVNEIGEHLHAGWLHVPDKPFAAVFAAAVILYFWRKNIIGLHESSGKALRIMQVTTVMVVTLIVWCLVTIFISGWQPVPLPAAGNLKFGPGALGWLEGTALPSFTLIAVLVGLGHSLLAMSGEETLAQVNREIAHPKLKNLERAGFVIFLYSMVFTSLVSFFAVMLIPDAERGPFLDNLIGGLSMHLAGPLPARLAFHVFVVLVGTVLLAGAVNTAIIGSNGVLNRVAEDGVLPGWFRHPHRKFGTTHRMINLIVGLQLAPVLLTRGDVEMLGQAYAFGVVWSFAMKGLAVLVLRLSQPGAREWSVPLNFRVGGTETAGGAGADHAGAVRAGGGERAHKEGGDDFRSVVHGGVFRRLHAFRTLQPAAGGWRPGMEKFRLDTPAELSAPVVNVRPGNVLVAVRNPNHLDHLRRVLEKTDTRRMDIVALAVRQVTHAVAGEHGLTADQIFAGPKQSYLRAWWGWRKRPASTWNSSWYPV